jgi:hypothetical protein
MSEQRTSVCAVYYTTRIVTMCERFRAETNRVDTSMIFPLICTNSIGRDSQPESALTWCKD